MSNQIDYIESNYLTKEKLIYKGVSSRDNFEDYWNNLQSTRKQNSRKVPLKGKSENNFWYNITTETKESIYEIEELGRDKIEDIIPDEVKNEALIESLIDEAFSSSWIEGAYSTRKRAHEMIKNDLDPKNKSEKMILNNYEGLLYTLENIESDIEKKNYVIKLWKILTKETLEEDEITESYRDDHVYIHKGSEIIYEGPTADKVDQMMDDLYSYIDQYDLESPIIKACVIHYYFVYVHPFFDGNGRTARALMNLFLIKSGYEFFKYFSISKILTEKRKQYYSAIENCEANEGDLTYFIDFYTKLLLDTMKSIRKTYLGHFGKQVIMDLFYDVDIILNERQEKLVTTLFKSDKKLIDVKEYTKKYKIVQETARKDLQELVDLGVLKRIKRGKKYIFKLEDLQVIVDRIKEL